jgi:hypothetical protein
MLLDNHPSLTSRSATTQKITLEISNHVIEY